MYTKFKCLKRFIESCPPALALSILLRMFVCSIIVTHTHIRQNAEKVSHLAIKVTAPRPSYTVLSKS